MLTDIKSTHYEHAARQHNSGGVGLFCASLGCSRRWSQPRGTSLHQSLAPLKKLPDEIWDAINDALGNYWNVEVGYGGWPDSNSAVRSISNWLQKEHIIFTGCRLFNTSNYCTSSNILRASFLVSSSTASFEITF